MRKTISRLTGIIVAAMAVTAATAVLPAPAAVAGPQATVAISGASNGAGFCLNHNASAVPCSTTSNRWLFTTADPAKNSYRIVAATGSWSTCLEQQAGTDHLRLATCAWNTGQLWIPVLINGFNLLVNDGTRQCVEMNRTNEIPNGVVTVTGCRNHPAQYWTWR